MAIRYLRAAAAAAAILAAASACAAPEIPRSVVPSPPTLTASAAPFTLLTHCGIHEIRVQETFFAADQPLDDGNGNPPAGWDNPYQQGTITVEGNRAVFRDSRGHMVTFHERLGATSFIRTCS